MKKIKIQIAVLTTLLAVLSVNNFYGQVKNRSKKKTPRTPAAKVTAKTTSADSTTSQNKNSKPFVSKEGRFSIVPPQGFIDFKRNEFNSVSSWGDPMTVVQFFSYSVSTPAQFVDNPQNYVIVMYFDYSASITSVGFNSELLEIVHKSTFRKFPEFNLTKTEREYWNTETGKRSPTERLDDTVYNQKTIFPLIRTFAQTASGEQQVRMESYLINQRIYWVIASYDGKDGFGKDAAKNFGESFRLISEAK